MGTINSEKKQFFVFFKKSIIDTKLVILGKNQIFFELQLIVPIRAYLNIDHEWYRQLCRIDH